MIATNKLFFPPCTQTRLQSTLPAISYSLNLHRRDYFRIFPRMFAGYSPQQFDNSHFISVILPLCFWNVSNLLFNQTTARMCYLLDCANKSEILTRVEAAINYFAIILCNQITKCNRRNRNYYNRLIIAKINRRF